MLNIDNIYSQQISQTFKEAKPPQKGGTNWSWRGHPTIPKRREEKKDPSSKKTDSFPSKQIPDTESWVSQHSHWVQESGQFMWDSAGKFSEGDDFSPFYNRKT